jgi:hypothetical protein
LLVVERLSVLLPHVPVVCGLFEDSLPLAVTGAGKIASKLAHG